MQEHWNVEDYKKYQRSQSKQSKYKSIKTSIDGHTFDSRKEAEYYNELKLRLKTGEIKGFCLQPTFILAEEVKYKPDFIIFNNDNTSEIIDVKGFKTKEYKIKKKIFEDKFNLKIKEV